MLIVLLASGCAHAKWETNGEKHGMHFQSFDGAFPINSAGNNKEPHWTRMGGYLLAGAGGFGCGFIARTGVCALRRRQGLCVKAGAENSRSRLQRLRFVLAEMEEMVSAGERRAATIKARKSRTESRRTPPIISLAPAKPE
jgi:hypothetical protein